MRSASLFLLVLVDFVVAVLMVITAVRFVVSPDPAIKAGPMYVVLALTTGSALLMFVMALNASFVPLMTPMHARDVRLVMWTMAATGVVTGMLTLGTAVQGIVLRLFVGGPCLRLHQSAGGASGKARRTGRLGRTAPRPSDLGSAAKSAAAARREEALDRSRATAREEDWWRRRESNPRPRTPRRSLYRLSRRF